MNTLNTQTASVESTAPLCEGGASYIKGACGDCDNKASERAHQLHPETEALIDRFSVALKEKLSQAEQKYGYSEGWMRTDWMDECRAKLLEHVAKGDPRDVAAYCAFLWHHAERTSAVEKTDEGTIALGEPLPRYRRKRPNESTEDYRVAMGWDVADRLQNEEALMKRFHGDYSDPYADAEDRRNSMRRLKESRDALQLALSQQMEAELTEAYAEGRKDEAEQSRLPPSQGKGYALLGTGAYVLSHTAAPPDPELGAELIIRFATDTDHDGNRQLYETRDTDGGMIEPEAMVVRIGFREAAALDALEKQLRHLREENFPQSL